MFSMFPNRPPGAGLVLLRVAGGSLLVIQSAAYFGDKREHGLLVLVVISLIIIVGLLLLIGPGAFSIDARLFGRREIIIPPLSSKT